jgi:class I fructose-bisphosphate aldolase
MTPRVREILSWYGADNPGVLTNMARVLNHGRLAGTGKLVIYLWTRDLSMVRPEVLQKTPMDMILAIMLNWPLNQDAMLTRPPLGFIEAVARDFAGDIPLILKVNNSDTLFSPEGPCSAVTSSVDDALRLGCVGIGFTIYPGSSLRKQMYEEIQQAAQKAKEAGLLVVIWSYARGEQLSKEGETAIDVISYAAQIAAQLGAHFIKVKPPTAHIEQEEARKVYESEGIPVAKLSDRAKHVVESCFNGKRVVIFSGGAAKGTEEVLNEVKELAQGGAFGSIMGRNAFQRPKKEAIELLHSVMDTYVGQI